MLEDNQRAKRAAKVHQSLLVAVGITMVIMGFLRIEMRISEVWDAALVLGGTLVALVGARGASWSW